MDNDALANRTLGVISEMLSNGQRDSITVVRKLYKDRTLLLDALIQIRDLNTMHSEALTFGEVRRIVDKTLEEVEE